MTTNKNIPLSNIFLSLCLFLHLTASTTTTTNTALNCGDNGDSTGLDGRKWTGDNQSKFTPPNQNDTSSISIASTQDNAPTIPYMTARIFHSQFTYNFPISPGAIFIRLHFHPTSYSGLNISKSFFSVTTNNQYTLLYNFSASLTSRFLGLNYFVKEFCINIVLEQSLRVTFDPFPGSFGFINGIEVVWMPRNLYFLGREIPIIGTDQTWGLDNNTALEMIFRLTAGGRAISPANDTGFFRAWSQDIGYIYDAATGVYPYNFGINIRYSRVPPYTAPEDLYRTARSMGTNPTINENYNLTWGFPVDSGFNYLVRLHFCEIAPQISEINQRVFEIFLNNITADDQMDIINYAGQSGVPIYREFMVLVPQGSGGKQDLWLALHPNKRAQARYSDALVNGLEIFKLNKSDGTLAGPNPNLVDDSTPYLNGSSIPKMNHSKKTRILIIVASVLSGVVGFSVLVLFMLCRRSSYYLGSSCRSFFLGPYPVSGPNLTQKVSLPSELCHQFSFVEIKSATNDFSDALLIGVGGFGNVYKGHINGGDVPVAIKRLNSMSQQGAHEFRTEIKMLSKLRHVHLVSLIGYCADQGEMILVYDYMARGSLREHLYNTDHPPLTWKQRLKICIGAARGLHYLHSGAKHVIIHRDVKSSNILLDQNWEAKVSDFGLCRVGPTSNSITHVSTTVKGTFGYLDPEYYLRQQLTEKSDVYSFGVVLYEVLCGRPPLDKNREKDELCLSEWARFHYESGTIDQIVDPNLKGEIARESLSKFGEVANNCLLDQGNERPEMADVLWNLEFALQLQETSEKSRTHKDLGFVVGPNIDDVVDGLRDGDLAIGKFEDVFSEIKSPTGR